MKQKMKERLDRMGRFKQKKRWILLILAALMSEMFTIGGGFFAYGATELTGLSDLGDSVTKTYSDGQNWSFTSKIKASYTIELYGPKANGSNAGNGGYAAANVVLEEGQTIEINLGPGAPAMSGSRDGAKGNSGSGYGDTGIYKATVMSGETTIMTAGGGGAAGNPGAGNGGHIRDEHVGTLGVGKVCGTCGYIGDGSPYAHSHKYYSGVGGAGGPGADGGNAIINKGGNGSAGSSSYWTGDPSSQYRRINYGGGGSGGAGGDGGASYTNPLYCTSPMLSSGLSPGVSKITITMGGEILPELDSKLLIEVKNEILAAIASMGGIAAEGGHVPEITVVAGKQFKRTVAAYTDMEGGSAGGVNVENDDKGNQTIRVSGRLDEPGDREIVIGGRSFLFHVVDEPDSANVMVVFD